MRQCKPINKEKKKKEKLNKTFYCLLQRLVLSITFFFFVLDCKTGGEGYKTLSLHDIQIYEYHQGRSARIRRMKSDNAVLLKPTTRNTKLLGPPLGRNGFGRVGIGRKHIFFFQLDTAHKQVHISVIAECKLRTSSRGDMIQKDI